MTKGDYRRIVFFIMGLALGIYMVSQFGKVDSYLGAFTVPAMGILAGVLMTPLLANLVSNPFGNFYFSEKRGKVEPIYSIPEKHRHEGRYEEAFRAYMAILHEDPQQLKAYQGMIDVASRELKDENLANQALQAGLNTLEDEEQKESLRELHKAYISRLHPGEFNQRQQNIQFNKTQE